MATLILSAVGQAVGGPIGAGIGEVIGSLIDAAAINALTPGRQVGQRLTGLQVESAADGAPMPVAFGRARLSGQVIWAARFREKKVEQQSGGGKGGPKSYAYSYSLSFAVALCEGPVDGVGRIWADGQPLDLSTVTMRVHRGVADDTPDALIEAVEGSAPAYRGTAYLVFEDLVLDLWGARPPQISAEVFRRAGSGGLEDKLTSVCLIPGAGEFVYATEPVLRRDGLTKSTAENVNNASGRPDLLIALDQLQAQLPNVTAVTLVVAWFGTDLRCGVCQIRPGADQAVKATIPFTWRAGGVGRDGAHVISIHDGGAAYGGTPSDLTVLQVVAELKARGLAVTLYPFVMMDVAPGNGLPDPYGGAEQAAYPWRGRITCHPAPGRTGSPDRSSTAASQAAAFFGAASAGDFTPTSEGADYAGDPDDWGLRRMVLHCAALAQAAGGVDGFLIGSELRGLTTLRGAGGAYPAVEALRALASECRILLGGATAIGYAGDWSEYFGHQPPDGSGEAIFHLDPLWADDAIDFVGVDFYPPLSDWRDGSGHLDALAGFKGPHDPGYLAARAAAGEDFDWFYASRADRDAQVRTPITDGAYGEPWIYRAKDLVSWWSNPHHDRPGGVRSATPTGWAPMSKPIRLTEFGCPAVDKGANSPNLFVDPKSAESGLPPYSSGARDDRAQRAALEGVLDHFADPLSNPTSTLDGRPMVETMSAWCWDARPFPDFPARVSVWADGPNWSRGHWLTGRVGAGSGEALAQAVLARYGVTDADVSGAAGSVDGYVIAQPCTGAEALQPLGAALAFDAAERGGAVALTPLDASDHAAPILGDGELALPDDRGDRTLARTLSPTPDLVRVRFIDGAADYQSGAATVRAGAPGGAGPLDIGLPVVMTLADAEAIAAASLARAPTGRDVASVHVSPLTVLTFEPGDLVRLQDADGVWRVRRVDLDEDPKLTLVRLAEAPASLPAAASDDWRPSPTARPPGPPVLHLMDLPPLDGFEDDARPVIAAAADPWRPLQVQAGPSAEILTPRSVVQDPAVVGGLLSALPPGPAGRWDDGSSLELRIEGGLLSSASDAAVFAGANALAVRSDGGEWEIVQFAAAEATGPDAYRLTRLLRGQLGSEPAMFMGASVGAPVVLFDAALARGSVSASERGLPLVWTAAAGFAPVSTATETFTWTGLAYRPFAPARASATLQTDGGVAIAWVRRTRTHGDPWDGEEVPLSEATEAYRCEVMAGDGATVLRGFDAETAALTYAAADIAADFPAETPASLTLRVRQRSAIYGLGSPLQQTLWL